MCVERRSPKSASLLNISPLNAFFPKAEFIASTFKQL